MLLFDIARICCRRWKTWLCGTGFILLESYTENASQPFDLFKTSLTTRLLLEIAAKVAIWGYKTYNIQTILLILSCTQLNPHLKILLKPYFCAVFTLNEIGLPSERRQVDVRSEQARVNTDNRSSRVLHRFDKGWKSRAHMPSGKQVEMFSRAGWKPPLKTFLWSACGGFSPLQQCLFSAQLREENVVFVGWHKWYTHSLAFLTVDWLPGLPLWRIHGLNHMFTQRYTGRPLNCRHTERSVL